MPPRPAIDVAIVGAGAAGLMTAIAARRAGPALRVALVDGASRPGAKILVSGGSRCNITNVSASDRDFNGGRPAIVRRVLRAFPCSATVAFFRELGVPLHEEAGGKLFPDSNRSRDVLDALLREVHRLGVTLLPAHRVIDVQPGTGGFRILTRDSQLVAGRVVLATGGQALPKSGSDGFGFELARRLGHSVVTPTPALVPLLLADDEPMHRRLSGVSHDVELSLWVDGAVSRRFSGPLLWTHFGVSGPVVLDLSRHWLRAVAEGREASVTVNLCGGRPFDVVDRGWTHAAVDRPRSTLRSALGEYVPAAVAAAMLDALRLDPATELAHLGRDDRRTLVHALVASRLPVTGSRGDTFAEATAGGVALDEVDPATMGSRLVPGLAFAGELLDVDGRLGGFNFQWAWSSGFVAGRALARPG